MTLNTKVLIAVPMNPKEIFDYLVDLLGRDFNGTPRWEHDEPHVDRWGNHRPAVYSTTIGQGLRAWTMVKYASDGPLVYHDDEELKEFAEEDWFNNIIHNEHCIQVSFDTAYGYRSSTGASCSDLHAWLIVMLAGFLRDKGVPTDKWSWQNEYKGEWYLPTDTAALIDFGDPVAGELPEKASR
jgi:hypothetical protein